MRRVHFRRSRTCSLVPHALTEIANVRRLIELCNSMSTGVVAEVEAEEAGLEEAGLEEAGRHQQQV